MADRVTRTGRALFVELLVVFLGVLIALAADSWRESLQDDAREAEYLESLRTELEEANQGLARGLAETQTRVDRITEFLELLVSSRPIPDTLLAPHPDLFLPVVPTGTLDALVAGAMELVSESDVRSALLTQRAVINNWLDTHRMLTVVWEESYRDYLEAREDLRQSLALPAGPLPARVLRDQPDMVAIYLHHRSVLIGQRNAIERTQGPVSTLLDVLGGGT